MYNTMQQTIQYSQQTEPDSEQRDETNEQEWVILVQESLNVDNISVL